MIQTYETIHLETDARGIARLVLNRPDKHNALNAAMIREITDAAMRLANDNSVRAVVLSANGRSFCAGGDLVWMKQQFDADHTTRVLEASHLAAMLRCLDELPKLLIAVIEGSAFGGGVGLAAVCDIVLAAPDAKFALTETKLGLIPATIAPVLLRRIGLANIRRFALNACPFGAVEAQSIGLISEIHERQELGAAVERQIDLALACAPGAIADAKQLFRRVAAGAISQSATAEALAARWEADETRQGVEAFFLHRRPPWAT
jgi:methylglutaconyl-CoA hydratase